MTLPLYLFGTVFILCSVLLFFKFLNKRKINYFTPPLRESISVEIPSYGLYSVSFVGGKFIKNKNNFKIAIFDAKGNSVTISESVLKLPFSTDGRPSVETFFFKATEGQYRILIDNPENLELRKSRLLVDLVFGQRIKTNQIGVLIKEAVTDRHKIIVFLLFIAGLLLRNSALVLDMYYRQFPNS